MDISTIPERHLYGEQTSLLFFIANPPVTGTKPKLVLPATVRDLKVLEESVLRQSKSVFVYVTVYCLELHFLGFPWWNCERARHIDWWYSSRARERDFHLLLVRIRHGDDITNIVGPVREITLRK
jgi:hypothetical protein